VGPNYKGENRRSDLRPERCEHSLFSVKVKIVPYVTDLLENCLSRACHADIYTVFDNPGDVDEPANSLNKVAYEK